MISVKDIFLLLTFISLILFATRATSADLIRKSYRPPNYETPIAALDQEFTPNNLFFERSHLAGIAKVDATSWKLEVHGEGIEIPLTFTLADLQDPKKFEQVTLAAVAVCSGNRRGLFDPHVPGVQWGHGAMGNAIWTGVRLRDVLKQAKLKAAAVELVFDGADVPVLDKTPDYRKSLPTSKALDPDTLIAFTMNGEPLPEAQGFPARLVVPGWTATYWMKQLVSIEAVTKPFDGFWMKSAYRVPKGAFPQVEVSWPSQTNDVNVPITEIIVNSLITKPAAGTVGRVGEKIKLSGFAWDSGHGITQVEVSTDAGKTWQTSQLGKNHGPYAWRRFTYEFKAPHSGKIVALSRATNAAGHRQPEAFVFNPAGYHHNVPQGLSPQSMVATGSHTEDVKLKASVGHEKVLANCGMCHSLDYIEMNSKFLDRKGWANVVTKMIKVYGAPIEASDVPVVVDYLANNFGGLVSP